MNVVHVYRLLSSLSISTKLRFPAWRLDRSPTPRLRHQGSSLTLFGLLISDLIVVSLRVALMLLLLSSVSIARGTDF